MGRGLPPRNSFFPAQGLALERNEMFLWPLVQSYISRQQEKNPIPRSTSVGLL